MFSNVIFVSNFCGEETKTLFIRLIYWQENNLRAEPSYSIVYSYCSNINKLKFTVS